MNYKIYGSNETVQSSSEWKSGYFNFIKDIIWVFTTKYRKIDKYEKYTINISIK